MSISMLGQAWIGEGWAGAVRVVEREEIVGSGGRGPSCGLTQPIPFSYHRSIVYTPVEGSQTWELGGDVVWCGRASVLRLVAVVV